MGGRKKVNLQVDTFLNLRVYCTPVYVPYHTVFNKVVIILWLLIQTKSLAYSSNVMRKAKNQHLNIVCQNLIGQFHEFRAKVLRFY